MTGLSKRTIVFWAMVALLLDQVSKEFVVRCLPLIGEVSWTYPYGGIPIFQDFLGIEFSISFTTNKGAAWGMGRDYPHLLNLFRVLVIGALSWVFWFRLKLPGQLWALGLILAGATGNVIDYMRYGHVIDMLNFKFWGYDYPVFNLADSFIFIGVAILIILSFIEKPEASGPTEDTLL